jgi:hypothetical protein
MLKLLLCAEVAGIGHDHVGGQMPGQSISMMMFLEPFKAAAAEGAVVELKLRLLAGKIPTLQKYAHQKKLEDIEAELAKHFGGSLSDAEKETLRLCRQLRNKVLHTDFCAARGKLNELGIETSSGDIRKIDVQVVSMAKISHKLSAAKAGTEGTLVAETLSTDSGSVLGWFLEAGNAGDFQKASIVFKGASAIVDRLADIEIV